MKKMKERALNTDLTNVQTGAYPCSDEDVGEVHFARLYSSLHTVVGHEWRTQPNGITNESLSEQFDFARWHNEPRIGALNETAPSLTSIEDTPKAESVPSKKSLQYLPAPSFKLLQKLQENKVNLIVVATSLDESEIVKKLNTTLDPETCSMMPLPLTDVGASKYRSDAGSSSEELDTEDDEAEIGNEKVVRGKRISRKRKSELAKDTRYWKRRNSNNEAAKRSRLAKRSRFVWIEKKTKELEEENIKLAKQLKSLESRVSDLEERDAKQKQQKE